MNYRFHIGDTRAVLALPSWSIVIKVPRPRLDRMRRYLEKEVEGESYLDRARWLVRAFRKYNVDVLWSPQWVFFKGLVDNWREWRFSQTFPHPVIAKTYASIGIINVQAYAHPFAFEVPQSLEGIVAFAQRFIPIIGMDIHRDSHHFENPNNFGVIDGHFVTVDYASPRVQSVLRQHADALVRSFPLT